jgi:5,10-methylenetetrahydromethanopterin reductase
VTAPGAPVTAAGAAATAPPRLGVVFRPQLPPEQLRAFVTLAEQAGLDDVWLWEDCFLEGGLTASVAALAWTDSLRVGLGLMPVPFRNPALAAMEVATIARLFPGRFVPAAGHGVQSWMEQVGARAASPMTLLREWVVAVRALLHGETVTTSGSYVRLDGVALDWPPAAVPPLLVGARGPRTLALASEVADGVVLDAGNPPNAVRDVVVQTAARRPPEVVVYVPAGASAGPVEAEQAAAGRPLRDATAVGPPADIAVVVGRYADAGATTVVLQPAATELDIEPFIRLAAETRTALYG